LASVAGIANALIININDVNGVGYFKDTDTGYTWMDVDNFTNMNYFEVENALTGTDFHIGDR
jgi:predicted metal-dependent phosphotriesterase family hydrolase